MYLHKNRFSRLAALLIAIVSPCIAPAARAQSFTVLHAFSGPDGFLPQTPLVLGTDGSLYGTTLAGGEPGYGNVFRVSPAGLFEARHTFLGEPGEGSNPLGPLTPGPDGIYYGTTQSGGVNNTGTIYGLRPDGTLFTVFDFPPDSMAAGGLFPLGGLIRDADGRFYGTTSSGGKHGNGTVFRVEAGGSVLTSLFDFRAGDYNVRTDLVAASDGGYYGVASGSGSNYGFLFKVAGDGVSVLHSFDSGAGGAYPVSAPVLAADGRLYGTTRGQDIINSPGTATAGTVYRLNPDGSGFELLHTFAPGADGTGPVYPEGGLLQGADGVFYGTTYDNAGTGSFGTIFAFVPAADGVGTLIVLRRLGVGDPAYLQTRLVQAADGALCGVSASSANGYGAVFRQTPSPGTLAFDRAAVTANENGGSVRLSVTRAAGRFGAVSVLYATADGTAVQGVDYTPASGTLTWADGDTSSRTVVVPIIDRGLTDGSVRAFRLVLGQPTGGAVLGGIPSAGITVAANNVALVTPPVITSATAADASVGAPFVYQITADHDPTSYAATGLPGGLSLDPASGLISGAPTQPGTFVITLSAANAGGAGSAALTLTVVPALPVVTLTATKPIVTAGSGEQGVFALNLSERRDGDLVVNFKIKGTAVNGTDYVLLKSTKKIKAGKTKKAIRITPLGTGAGPGTKRTVVLVLQSGEGYTVGTEGKVKVRIIGQ